MSENAQEVLELCQQRSFMNSIAGGQKGKNRRGRAGEVSVTPNVEPTMAAAAREERSYAPQRGAGEFGV